MNQSLAISYVTTGHDNIASFRYRIACPSNILAKKGIRPVIDPKADPKASVVCFSKHWTYNDWSYAKFCRLRGQKVIFDVCDDHFQKEGLKEHYLRMVDVANVVTVNSETMRQTVLEATGRDSIVIHDPVLSPRQEFKGVLPLHLVWYGQVMNLQGLFDVYTEELEYPLEIVIGAPVNPPEHFKKDHVSWTQWHKDVIAQVAKKATVALLPYRQGKDAKSANRVLEALWSGMPVITDRIPSVAALGDNGIIDLKEAGGLPQAITQMYLRGMDKEVPEAQSLIAKTYSPEAVGSQWENLIRSLA